MKLIYTITLLLLVLQSEATVRRVRAGNTSPGNGLSWSTAYTDLQAAINASASGDEVWVAIPVGSAIYRPASGISYTMKDGVKVYGGFVGSETALSSRNWQTNKVTLQGNAASVIKCDNSLTNSTLLDGFTITGGNSYFGGGIDAGGSSLVVANLIITGNNASSGGGGFYTFGNSLLTNVVIMNNTANGNGSGSEENGAGLYCDQAFVTATNCLFINNIANKNGGGVYAYELGFTNSRKPTFINCVFSKNTAQAGVGGGLFGTGTSFILTNCNIYGNRCALTGAGAGVNNYYGPTSGPASSTIIKNCLFYSNRNTTSNTLADVVNGSNTSSTITYSMLVDPPTGPGNIVPPVLDPFLNPNSPSGADNLWFTGDDGFTLSICNAAMIDKGDNNGVTVATDAAGLTRKVDVPLVTDGGSGTAPVIDMGAYENQITTTLLQLAGSIGNAHTVPNPQELPTDIITSTQAPLAGTTIRWEQQTSGSSNWVTATPAGNATTYPIPALTQTTSYRRIVTSATYCNTPYYSNMVQIKVANPSVAQAGAITGRITSPNGTTGVDGIQIRVIRKRAIPGSPAGYTYLDTTKNGGLYSVKPVFYGDLDSNTSTADFTIRPFKQGHTFNPDTATNTVGYYTPNAPAINFIDKTVLGITGRIYQQCEQCLNLSNIPTTITCPIDSINIYKDGNYATKSQYLNGSFGQYAVTVSDPIEVRIEPRFAGHSFDTSFKLITPLNDVAGVNFKDTTTHTISGRFTAGCGELIGTATLEFYDTLSPDAYGNIRPQQCFRKQTRVDSNGYFSIRLPARAYKVRMVLFEPFNGTNLQATDVTAFINTKLPADSLYRDILTRDTVLNLVYVRPPFIAITEGLPLISCASPLSSFSVVKQAEIDSFRVKVFQGTPASYATGCAFVDSINKVVFKTNISTQSMSALDSAKFSPTQAGALIKLKGGAPNVAGNHFKSLELHFTDRYGRPAQLVRDNILVTGALQDAGANFFTVNPPPIPLLVLHDPPGDGSYSYWQNTKSTQTAFRMYASSASENGGWLEVKLGTKLSTGIFVSTESEVWASVGGTTTQGKTNTTATEQVFTNTYTSALSTSATTSEVGTDGDVYVGMALNMIYTSATEVRNIGCQIKDTVTMIFAPGGVPTEFHYSEKQIKTAIIPSLMNTYNLQPTQFKKDSVMNIVKQWQQMIANNATNRANASSTGQNISFNGGGSTTSNSYTTAVTKSSTTEFSMNINTDLAIAAGFEIAGSGVSGGAIVNFKTETGESTTLANTTETTVGYQLSDANSGDQFTVNIKKDQQSGTPVFELLAGQSSCPPEEGTQLRDQIQLSTPNSIATDTNQVGTLEYRLKLGNISAISTDASRSFNVFLDAASNSDGAEVSINGVTNTNAGNPVVISVGRRQEQFITVRVRKIPTSPVFSYTGLAVVATDACGDITDTTRLSAYFISPCSNVKLDEPGDNWIQAGNSYQKQVLVKGYDRTGLSTINLQYTAAGSSGWIDVGPIFTPASLNPNTVLGTSFLWNTSGIPDGAYSIRLKLVCSQGITYSEKVNGIIDHTAPALLGKPKPTDDNYVNGDVISFSYNESIAVNSISTSNVTITRLTNGVATPVEITVSAYGNSIVILPVSSITNFIGSTMQIIVKDVYDVYGNKKITPDTSYFLVGTTIVATGTNAMNVAITKPKVSKNTDSTTDISFRLPVVATDSIRVNYTIGGTARLGKDYNIEYVGYQPSYAYFTAAQGAIRLPKASNQVMFKIHPIGDTALTPDKTVTISLSEGGDYALGDTTTRTGVITSEDGISTYTFIGNGNFSDKANWLNGKAPLTTLVAGKTILINPSGVCTLDVPLTIKTGASIRVMANRSFIIQGNLKLN